MEEKIRLTKLAKTSGCAAKIGPDTLAGLLEALPSFSDDALLVGFGTSDDAAVYRISDDLAVIQTLDFFPPVVDDPYLFGQIAAANALSDVYAMGGVPKTALNIVGFPGCLDHAVLGEILKGGADKVREAGAVLAGGHSIHNDEPLYGLSVTGLVHPDRIWRNTGARAGDALILTKPIGSGLVNTAVRADMASKEALEEAITSMRCLNRTAAEVLSQYEVHACTDVTGFGLLCHGLEMACGSGVMLEINPRNVPFITDAAEYAMMGLVPAGAYRNRKHAGDRVAAGDTEEYIMDLLFDPQTSGGLLASVPAEQAPLILQGLKAAGLATEAAVIGRVLTKQEKEIILI